MPVDFFVDPRFADDPDTRDVHNITLSYTFFTSAKPDGATDLGRFADAAPDAEAGSRLFAANCSGCHAIDHTVAGPKLAGVVGRTAGAVPGYPYSPALAASGVVWDASTLDRWLAGPQQFVPGAMMPMSIPDAARRRDIIAYLQTLPAQPGQPRQLGQATPGATPATPPG